MDSRKRKRGIRASREKLELAMAKKGFTTQLELARQIARDENLDIVPKDLVNKVFRELAVSPHNLGRIAKALNVEVHTIYLATHDQSVQHVLNKQKTVASDEKPAVDKDLTSQTKTHSPVCTATPSASVATVSKTSIWRKKSLIMSIMLIVLSVASLVFYWHVNNANSPELVNQKLVNTRIHTPLGKVLIVIQTKDETMLLAKALAAKFDEQSGVSIIIPETPATYDLSALDAIEKWQAHGVLRFSLNGGSHYQHISLSLSSKQHSSTLAQWFMRKSERIINRDALANFAKEQMIHFIEGSQISELISDSKLALKEYLLAINTLFYSHSAMGLDEAEQHFKTTIDIDPDFAQAYAYLCLIHVRKSWIEDEVSSLEKAAFYCDIAQNKAPTDINTLIAKSELQLRTGEDETLMPSINALTSIELFNADALASLAELYLHLNQSQSEVDYSEQIVDTAKKALELEPKHWRAANTLGNYYFSLGDISTAKQHLASAAEVVDHEVILANLGTMQLCFDNLDKAKTTYQTIINVAENNYLGHENLGSVYLMLHEFDKALEQKLISIEKQPDIAIHQVWGGLAQAYSLTGNKALAFARYSDALTLVERDELLGNASLSDQLHKLYYKVKLNELAPQDYVIQDYKAMVERFISQRSDLDLKARSHLAWLAGKLNKQNAKSEIIEEITAICPVYRRSPELSPISNSN